jgi:hypothetical protein
MLEDVCARRRRSCDEEKDVGELEMAAHFCLCNSNDNGKSEIQRSFDSALCAIAQDDVTKKVTFYL